MRWLRFIMYSRHTNIIHLGLVLVLLGIVTHFLACAWHAICDARHWEQALAGYGDGGGGDDGGGDGESDWDEPGRVRTLYVLSLYESVLILMGEQLELATDRERLFTTIAIVVGAIVLAIVSY